MPVRLVLVDDHEMVIEGLRAMLTAFADRVEVVGQAINAEQAMAVIAQTSPGHRAVRRADARRERPGPLPGAART